MTEQERAAAMADEIDIETLDLVDTPNDDVSMELSVAHWRLIAKLCRAYARPSQDYLRHAIINVIAPVRIPGGLRHDEYCGAEGLVMIADAILAILPQTQATSDFPRVRHLKRGSTYRVIGEAVAQVSTGEAEQYTTRSDDIDAPVTLRYVRDISDGERLTVYQCEKDGKLWVRFTDEFEDGRFERLDHAAGKEG